MNYIVGIYWLFIAIIVLYPNYLFFRKLKNAKGKTIIPKSIYFLMSLLLPFLIMFLFMAILMSPYLNQLTNLKIDYDTYLIRIMYAVVVFPLSFIANIYFAKFYFKRISKTKNEIELIGKE